MHARRPRSHADVTMTACFCSCMLVPNPEGRGARLRTLVVRSWNINSRNHSEIDICVLDCLKDKRRLIAVCGPRSVRTGGLHEKLWHTSAICFAEKVSSCVRVGLYSIR